MAKNIEARSRATSFSLVGIHIFYFHIDIPFALLTRADDGATTTDQDKVEKDKVDKEPAEKGPATPDKATLDQATQQAEEPTKEVAKEQGVGTDPAVKTNPIGGGLATAAEPATEQAEELTNEVAKEPAVGTDTAKEMDPAEKDEQAEKG